MTMPRAKRREFLRFLRRIDAAADKAHPRPCNRCVDPACCEEPVLCGETEAALVAAHARLHVPDALERIARWRMTGIEAEMARYDTTAPGSPAREYASARILTMGVRCPFLSDGGRCLVYAARPMACRCHVPITDDPAACRRRMSDGEQLEHVPPFYYIGEAGLPPRQEGRGLLPSLVDAALRGGS